VTGAILAAMRTPSWLIGSLLALLLVGCPTDPPLDDNVWVPDDDDTTAADDDDDDDDSGDDDDTTEQDDDDATDQDDDDSGDDDDSAPILCLPAEVLGQTCAESAWTDLALGASFDACPVGEHVFESEGTWASFLTSCGGLSDPLTAHDWSSTAVAGFVQAGTGCTATATALWVAECGGRSHLGQAFVACGDCEAEIRASAFVTLPRTALPFDSREACVPDSMTCD
jgi:hypothetical protein